VLAFKVTVTEVATGKTESVVVSLSAGHFREAALEAAETPFELWVSE
jgi:hypothetical protein